MGDLTMPELAKKMAKLDFTMFTTSTAEGAATSRPMSNNGDVEYDGTSYFFAYQSSRKVTEIRSDRAVLLSFTGAAGMLGGPPLFVGVEGIATLIDDKAQFAEHWTKDLDRYFPEGIDSPDIVMIRVDAALIRYWDGGDEGSITVN